MPTHLSIGFSQYPDPQKAVLQAAVQVRNQLDTVDVDLVIIFATPEYVVPETLETLTQIIKPKRLVGSSTGGVILSHGVVNHGIALVGIKSDEILFGISALNDIDNQDMHFVGFDVARRAAQDLSISHRETMLVFADGIEKNSSSFIRGAREALGSMFPVLGGISSDDFKYKKLSQFFQDQILHNAAVGLLLGGDFHLGYGCTHGFKPLGKPRTITMVDGGYAIRTIDNKPAIDIYKHYLGEEAKGIKNMTSSSHAALYPLGLYLPETGQYLLRNLIDILDDGSIVCHEGVPPGVEVHLMISNSDSCLRSAIETAKLVKTSLGGREPKLIFVFESLARQKILGTSSSNEIQAIRDVLGQTAPIIGMCSYGEIGPFGSYNDIKNVYLNNENILIVALA